MVVKFVIGWSLDCVIKVKNVDELRVVVKKVLDRYVDFLKLSIVVVVELYVVGLEVDVNFVMFNGEIVFVDINDDFFSLVDFVNVGLRENF